MAHPEQMRFVESAKARWPASFTGTRVLEIGSRDVNGSVRELFTGCQYVGLDCVAGPGVDVVCLAHEYRPGGSFDVVISCEAFEHDPYFDKTLSAALRALRVGGLFVATWASPLRPEHGTTRTGGEYGPNPDHYRGVSAEEFTAAVGGLLDPLEVVTGRDGHDVYAVGVRAAREKVARDAAK